MRITSKARYALLLLTDLAAHQGNGFVSLSDISERQHISKKYLEQIVPLLTRAGMLTTNRGNRGGYRLFRSASECYVGDVLRATEGGLLTASFTGDMEEDKFSFIWESIEKEIARCVDAISIQDILEHQNGSDYYCI